MLKIEVIKFEAQDVITASVAAPVETAPECKHPNFDVNVVPGEGFYVDCKDCDYVGGPFTQYPPAE